MVYERHRPFIIIPTVTQCGLCRDAVMRMPALLCGHHSPVNVRFGIWINNKCYYSHSKLLCNNAVSISYNKG